MNYEEQYLAIVKKILNNWQRVQTRNSETLSLFWEVLEIDCLENWFFPLITSRKIFTKWVVWEYAAFLRGPKTLDDFEKFGCNYWKLWAKEDRSINVDYGNKWIDFNGFNQLDDLIYKLKNNPTDRRLLISSWDPSNLKNLDLPCCHYAYQFYVRWNKLDIMWHQRSADFMVWVPSDIILAALMIITIWKEVWLEPWKIKMVFWDTHIYKDHIELAAEQVKNKPYMPCIYSYSNSWSLYDFEPSMIKFWSYNHHKPVKYKLLW